MKISYVRGGAIWGTRRSFSSLISLRDVRRKQLVKMQIFFTRMERTQGEANRPFWPQTGHFRVTSEREERKSLMRRDSRGGGSDALVIALYSLDDGVADVGEGGQAHARTYGHAHLGQVPAPLEVLTEHEVGRFAHHGDADGEEDAVAAGEEGNKRS